MRLDPLGILLGGSYSPFPALVVPPFVENKVGHWRLNKASSPPIIRGYFSGLGLWGMPNWVLTKESRIWMSVTPMELESLSHHVLEATGDVLVMGFGMGVVAWNLAKKSNVRRIRVVEKDADVVTLAHHLLNQPGWELLQCKVEIIHADALEFSGTADVVLADIWPQLGDMALRADLQKMAANIDARWFAAWGLELDFIQYCSKHMPSPKGISGKKWIEYSREIGVPLIMSGSAPKARVMAKAALFAAENVIMY